MDFNSIDTYIPQMEEVRESNGSLSWINQKINDVLDWNSSEVEISLDDRLEIQREHLISLIESRKEWVKDYPDFDVLIIQEWIFWVTVDWWKSLIQIIWPNKENLIPIANYRKNEYLWIAMILAWYRDMLIAKDPNGRFDSYRLWSISEEREVTDMKEYYKAYQDIEFHMAKHYIEQMKIKWDTEKPDGSIVKEYYDFKEGTTYFDVFTSQWTLRLKDIIDYEKIWILKNLSDDFKRDLVEKVKWQLLSQIMDTRFESTYVWWEVGWASDVVTREEIQSYFDMWIIKDDLYKKALEVLKDREDHKKEIEALKNKVIEEAKAKTFMELWILH